MLKVQPKVEEGPIVPFDLEAALMHQSEQAAAEICKDLGLRFRVIRRQGCPCLCTRDVIMTRINVVVEDGFITEVSGRG
jgi:hypothetical protein